MIEIPEAVRSRAAVNGIETWLDDVPEIVASLERDWELRVGAIFTSGSEAIVLDATLHDGTGAVLKLYGPGTDQDVDHEVRALRLAAGEGCALLLRDDLERGAMLLERLGPMLASFEPSLELRDAHLCDALRCMWRPVRGETFPTGAEKARWLAEFVTSTWEELDRPCSERTIEDVVRCTERRGAAHDDERAVLVHGDAHEWNALEASDGTFKLVDPDGLRAEPAYDVGVVLRQGPADIERLDRLAHRTGCDRDAIWEWATIERVSSGLMCTSLGLLGDGRDFLGEADRLSASS